MINLLPAPPGISEALCVDLGNGITVRAELELPEDVEGLPVRVVVEAAQLGEGRVPLAGWQGDLVDEAVPVADLDDVPARRQASLGNHGWRPAAYSPGKATKSLDG